MDECIRHVGLHLTRLSSGICKVCGVSVTFIMTALLPPVLHIHPTSDTNNFQDPLTCVALPQVQIILIIFDSIVELVRSTDIRYTQFRLYGIWIYGLFAHMVHFIPIFLLYGLLFYGLFAYMDHFSRDKRGPEAHFAKILCDVAHSKIILCATSHKIFAKWASILVTRTKHLSN